MAARTFGSSFELWPTRAGWGLTPRSGGRGDTLPCRCEQQEEKQWGERNSIFTTPLLSAPFWNTHLHYRLKMDALWTGTLIAYLESFKVWNPYWSQPYWIIHGEICIQLQGMHSILFMEIPKARKNSWLGDSLMTPNWRCNPIRSLCDY
jgi:hypothetical protein